MRACIQTTGSQNAPVMKYRTIDNPHSKSSYISARGKGEEAVEAAFPGATIVRPAVMIGKGDALLTTIMRPVRFSLYIRCSVTAIPASSRHSLKTSQKR
jgi:uncharacterized protein YbjT (DUF2867 family)